VLRTRHDAPQPLTPSAAYASHEGRVLTGANGIVMRVVNMLVNKVVHYEAVAQQC